MQQSSNTTVDPAEYVCALAESGETELATIVAIRLLAAGAGSSQAQLLNDLGVLRHAEGDSIGALACLRAALDADPGNDDARENLSDLSLASAPPVWRSADAGRETGAGTLNPWVVDALHAAERHVGLAGKRVLEVGGSVPADAVRKFGVSHWTACDLYPVTPDAPDYTTLAVDACNTPLESESMDAAYSVCAFEHFDDLGAVLAEVHRTLRPGARFFTQFAPIWTSAVGNHVWINHPEHSLVTFNDHVIPRWGHLALTEAELEAFLTITRGASLARAVSDYIWRNTYINRVPEAEFRRVIEASPFEVEVYEWWGGFTAPQPAMRAELETLWPDAGEFGAEGIRAVLRR